MNACVCPTGLRRCQTEEVSDGGEAEERERGGVSRGGLSDGGGEVYSVLTCGRSECYAKWRRRRWRKESMRAAGGGGGESCRVTVWRSQ